MAIYACPNPLPIYKATVSQGRVLSKRKGGQLLILRLIRIRVHLMWGDWSRHIYRQRPILSRPGLWVASCRLLIRSRSRLSGRSGRRGSRSRLKRWRRSGQKSRVPWIFKQRLSKLWRWASKMNLDWSQDGRRFLIRLRIRRVIIRKGWQGNSLLNW